MNFMKRAKARFINFVSNDHEFKILFMILHFFFFCLCECLCAYGGRGEGGP